MARVRVCLGLGSNLGDRRAHLKEALRLLAHEVELKAVSAIYETEPWGFTSQPRFLNCACLAVTSVSAQQLLLITQDVERSVGRQPSFRYGPRAIDVDILLYGRRTHRTAMLEIPHPRLAQRAFALVPLAEVAPHMVHPVLKDTIAALAERVEGKEGLKVWEHPVLLASMKESSARP